MNSTADRDVPSLGPPKHQNLAIVCGSQEEGTPCRALSCEKMSVTTRRERLMQTNASVKPLLKLPAELRHDLALLFGRHATISSITGNAFFRQ